MTDRDRRASDRFSVSASARRLARFVPAVVAAGAILGWLASAPAARADGDLVVSARGATDTRVVVTSARGLRQVEQDTDGDGVVSVRPNSGPGTYEIEITAGGVTEKASIEVPAVGTLAVSFASEAAAGSRITTETISQVEEITVTGLKHEQALQDVPASIQALTEETLEAMGADDFTDYARNVPALNFADLGPNRVEINLRGMGKLSAGNATVGVYIDDIAVADSFNNPDLKLFDVERVEILRGPQGTLYGESSMGGAIRLLTNPADPAGLAYKFDATGSSTTGGGENWFGNGDGQRADAARHLRAPSGRLPARRGRLGRQPDPRARGSERRRDRGGAGVGALVRLRELDPHAHRHRAEHRRRRPAVHHRLLRPRVLLLRRPRAVHHRRRERRGGPASGGRQLPARLLLGRAGRHRRLGRPRVRPRHRFRSARLDFTSDQKIVSGEARLADSGGEDQPGSAALYYKKWDQDNTLVIENLPIPGLGLVDFGNFIFFNTEDTSLFGEATHFFNDKWSGTAGARAFEEEKHDPFIQTIDGLHVRRERPRAPTSPTCCPSSVSPSTRRTG